MYRAIAAVISLLVAAASIAGAAGSGAITIVFCAPGHPSSTEQAQPTMDALAAALAARAGWGRERLRASYFPDEDGGLARLEQDDAAIAVVTLPFYLEHRVALGLRPILTAVPLTGAEEAWALVAPRGRVAGPADLDGWEVTGAPGFSAAFVRGAALAEWGELPASVRITPTSRVLSGLRRAANGEAVAVLLDAAQTEALDRLPFHDDLEIVTRSAPMPGTLVCLIDGRLPEQDQESIPRAFTSLSTGNEGREALSEARLVGFRELDTGRLAEVERAFDRALRTSP